MNQEIVLPSISLDKFEETIRSFYSSEYKKFLRLGQYFMNTVWPGCVHPKLYNETDNEKVRTYIRSHYVDF